MDNEKSTKKTDLLVIAASLTVLLVSAGLLLSNGLFSMNLSGYAIAVFVSADWIGGQDLGACLAPC